MAPDSAHFGNKQNQFMKGLALFGFVLLLVALIQAPPVRLAEIVADEVRNPDSQFRPVQTMATEISQIEEKQAEIKQTHLSRQPGQFLELESPKTISSANGNELINLSSNTFERRGYVYAKREVELKSQLAGLILTLSATEGQFAKQGQILVTLDSSVQDNLVQSARIKASAKADLESARLVAEQAKVDWERIKKIHANVAAAKEEVEAAHLKYKESLSKIDRAKELQAQSDADLKLEEAKLSQYTLRSPFDGQIREITSAAGATVTPNDPILKLVDINHLRAVINLPGSMFYDFKAGDKHQLKAGEPVNRIIEARVSHIDPAIEPASGTFRCYFDIDNPEAKLPYGFMVELIKP